MTLYPWLGRNVALLTASNFLDGSVMEQIINKLDDGYDIYAQITGREPNPYLVYSGIASIAQVPSAFKGGASAIGYLGFTGIEITNAPFNKLYDEVSASNTFDQTLFYELGRNFWFYGDQLGAFDPFVTGFAIVNRFISMQEAGVSGSTFNGLTFDEFKISILEDLIQTFLSGSSYTIANTLGVYQGVPSNNGWGAADLAASVLYQVFEDFGIEAYSNFYRKLALLPAASTQVDAFNNLVVAATQATGFDYGFLDKPAGISYITGGRASDSLFADGSGNPVFGFAGNDVIGGTAESDRLFGDSGDDALLGAAGIDNLVGGAGNDILFGGDDDDRLAGGAGDDTLEGGTGADLLVGGLGNDTYVVDNAFDIVIETDGQGADIVQSSVSFYMSGQELENLTLTGSAAINGTGNSIANTITGNSGANILNGLVGADTMIGGAGSDT
ncbi:calcium-binding protein, partial [Methylorubrum suomiense]|uniref:calcium-binding protein n=2 Tax=Methylorubrum suomiense TaxID=144191 RepID=UPI001EE2397C